MSEKCLCRVRPNALFFPYRPNRKGYGCCEPLHGLGQYCLPTWLPIVFATGVTIAAALGGYLDSAGTWYRSSIDTLVQLFGVFSISTIGYSTWARSRLTQDFPSDESPTNDEDDEGYGKALGGFDCADKDRSAFHSRISLHMIFTVVPYVIFLVVYVILGPREDMIPDDALYVMIFAAVWMLFNLFSLGCVGASLNDFLDSTARKRSESSSTEGGSS